MAVAVSSVLPAPVRRARAATFVFFAMLGFGCGSWLVCLPAIEARLGIDHAQLGWMLLATGVGSLTAMQFAGPLVDRFGPARTTRVAAVAFAAIILGPGLVSASWQLPVALFCVGMSVGSVNVAMNTHAVVVERAYRRPIITCFHAVFSLGGVLAAVLGGSALAAGWSPAQYLPVAAALCLAAGLVAGPHMLRAAHTVGRAEEPATITAVIELHNRPAPGRSMSRIVLLGGLAAMFMISEGVANDWSSVSLADTLDAPAAVAAWAYGAFSTTMTIGRLVGDRLTAWLGPVRIIRYGALVGAAGLALANLAPVAPLAIAGWAVVGIGLCASAPQIFSAAGNIDPTRAGKNLSMVVGVGNAGMLAGPALIGIATHFVPLNIALLIPVVFCLVASGGARLVGGGRPSPAVVRPRLPRPAEAASHARELGGSVRRGTVRVARRARAAAGTSATLTAHALPAAATATVVYPDWQPAPSLTVGGASARARRDALDPEAVRFVEDMLADLWPESRAAAGDRGLVTA